MIAVDVGVREGTRNRRRGGSPAPLPAELPPLLTPPLPNTAAEVIPPRPNGAKVGVVELLLEAEPGGWRRERGGRGARPTSRARRLKSWI